MNSGSAVAAFLNPTVKKKASTTNFARNNLAELKNMQARNAERKREEEAQANKPKFSLNEFKNVESKFSKVDENAPPQNTHSFLRRTSDPGPMSTEPYMSKKIKTKVEPVPSSIVAPVVHETKDFVQRNKRVIQDAEKPIAKVTKTTATTDSKNQRADYGKVPKYLQERNAEALAKQAQEEERVKVEANKGMKKMPEEERQQVLRALEENYAKLSQELHRFPLRVETPVLAKKKEALEDKLKEIIEARDKFSNPNIWIRA